jgi:hypothetical protein
MPASPRVVFAAFDSTDEPMLKSWIRFRDLVESADAIGPRRRPVPRSSGRSAGTATGSASARTGVWRVLASNNRELGRSSQTYASFDVARAHVATLQSKVDELVVTPVVGPQPGLYGWLLEHEGVPVITCGRWYASSSSRETVISTVAALSVAVITEAPRTVLDPQRRSTGRRLDRAGVAPW